MTETLGGMGPLEKKAGKKTVSPGDVERAAVRELVKAARARGEDLTGPDGLLKTITATVLESALEEEMTEHLGYDKHHPLGHVGGGNIRNGTRSKTVLTEAAGEVPVQVPLDRAGTFEPVVVRKRQRRLSDVDAVAMSLYAKGLTTSTPYPDAIRADLTCVLPAREDVRLPVADEGEGGQEAFVGREAWCRRRMKN